MKVPRRLEQLFYSVSRNFPQTHAARTPAAIAGGYTNVTTDWLCSIDSRRSRPIIQTSRTVPGAATIREIVERVVAEVFAAEMPRVQEEVIARVLEQLQPALAAHGKGGGSERLRAALAAIQEPSAQSDILRALLDAAAAFRGRAALFVARGGSAAGWQARGFRDDHAITLLALDLKHGLAARAMQQHATVAGPVGQFDARFVAGFGAPLDGACVLLPLVIRGHVAALLYADASTQASTGVDVAALEMLVRSAGLWIELLALRRAGAATATAVQGAPAATPVASPPPAAPVAAPSATEPAQAAVASAEAAADDNHDLHRKARRFAKLLVDEIKLYNQAKVAQGRQSRDLYDRLKDDIEKSRATYDKRYGQTAVATENYFTRELIRILADNNPTLLGNNFPR